MLERLPRQAEVLPPGREQCCGEPHHLDRGERSRPLSELFASDAFPTQARTTVLEADIGGRALGESVPVMPGEVAEMLDTGAVSSVLGGPMLLVVLWRSELLEQRPCPV